jgi:hypothetical protein
MMKKRRDNMPNHILTNDVIDEMIDNISVIKLNTYIQMSKEK